MSIWQFKSLSTLVNEEFQLSLDEGSTDLDEVDFDDLKIFIKREDQNPNGSFKDRSIAFMMSRYFEEGINDFTISSSGNAAISAANYSKLNNFKLTIFVSENLKGEKRDIINNIDQNFDNVGVQFVKRPKSDAIKYSRENNSKLLRASDDDLAVSGYKTISYELADENPDIDAIFIPTSSATSTVGIYEGYKELGIHPPEIHIVQTEKIHPIAKEFDKNFSETTASIANCVVDRVAKRKAQVMKILEETGGSGWVVSDDLIRNALEITQEIGIENDSPNSHLSLAGFIKAFKEGRDFENPCLIFSGI
ncbi:MAG TPA: pyridoxal-phosphate dependent enzyme [Candidatus Dojkabacteria bacterium]